MRKYIEGQTAPCSRCGSGFVVTASKERHCNYICTACANLASQRQNHRNRALRLESMARSRAKYEARRQA
jgi:hypothetical protein